MTRYESETDGTLREWKIGAGEVISRAGCVFISPSMVSARCCSFAMYSLR